ncbi:MAG: N-acetyltransferase [Acidimicrobiia bacterium]|nr:N-acetyltransferase [Acidimicrobiia bacterium]
MPYSGRVTAFLPGDFVVPLGLVTDAFTLTPLGPEHNERDHAAWMSSIEHIQTTPGFADLSWPRSMTLDENLTDLERHARDFVDRIGFTYTVLDAGDDLIGCVYIYPSDDPEYDADVRSWVRASHADLDRVLWRTVTDWLAADWPFRAVRYASR